MRIISFSQKWPKLSNPEFTTFRFKRRDADWQVGETVQIYLKSRSKNKEFLGLAQIISKEPRCMDWELPDSRFQLISLGEIQADGFENWEDMYCWLLQTYGINNERLIFEAMNKLTLRRLT